MVSWRTYQNRVKHIRWLKKVVILFLALLGLGLTLIIYRGFRWLATPPLQSDQFWMKGTSWDGKEQLNLWLPREKLIVALSPQERTLRYLRMGGRDAKEVRVPLDAYMFRVDGVLNSSGSQEPSDQHALEASLVGIDYRRLKTVRTNLTRWQLFEFWWTIRGLEESKFIETEDLSEVRIRAERLKVIILNGSGQAGLASEISKWVSNLGVEVIAVGNSEGAERLNLGRENKIKAYNLSHDSRTVQRLEQMLDAEAEFIESQGAQRADIVITVRHVP